MARPALRPAISSPLRCRTSSVLPLPATALYRVTSTPLLKACARSGSVFRTSRTRSCVLQCSPWLAVVPQLPLLPPRKFPTRLQPPTLTTQLSKVWLVPWSACAQYRKPSPKQILRKHSRISPRQPSHRSRLSSIKIAWLSWATPTTPSLAVPTKYSTRNALQSRLSALRRSLLATVS